MVRKAAPASFLMQRILYDLFYYIIFFRMWQVVFQKKFAKMGIWLHKCESEIGTHMDDVQKKREKEKIS